MCGLRTRGDKTGREDTQVLPYKTIVSCVGANLSVRPPLKTYFFNNPLKGGVNILLHELLSVFPKKERPTHKEVLFL